MWGFYNCINMWCVTFELIRKLVNEDSDRFLCDLKMIKEIAKYNCKIWC